MKRTKTISKYTLYLTTGNTVEILADQMDAFSTEEYMELRMESHLVAKFMENAILGYTREVVEDGRQNDNQAGN